MNSTNFWIDWYLIVLDILFVLGLIAFSCLPKSERANQLYWLLFFILTFTVLYENFGGYLIYNGELNEKVNTFLGNVENPNYNVWLYNISAHCIVLSCYMLIISSYVSKNRRNMIFGMLLLFLLVLVIFQLTKLEPVYGPQPLTYSFGASLVLISCVLYFMNLMKDPVYLEINPLRLLSFWQVTVILFNYSLTFLINNSSEYLWKTQPLIAESLGIINMSLGIISLLTIVAIIAAPNLPIQLERQPTHV